MKLSIFTTCTRPEERGDLFYEPLESYKGLADELIIVDGGSKTPNHTQSKGVNGVRKVYNRWPREFHWLFIGEQFQRGYEASTGDWVIHADLDYVFHENDYQAIREACERHNNAPALSFWKYQFILPDRYTLKSRLVIAVNKGKYGDRIKFDSGGDLCQPSLDGKEILPDSVPEAKIPFYNYEKVLKTRDQIKDDVGRMARAYRKHFGEYKLGGPDDESAYLNWVNMTVGRFNARSQERVGLSFHPEVMHETLRSLRTDQFGYSGFDLLERNDYVS